MAAGILEMVAIARVEEGRVLHQVNSIYRDGDGDRVLLINTAAGERPINVIDDEYWLIFHLASKQGQVASFEGYEDDPTAVIHFLKDNELVDELPLLTRAKIETMQNTAAAQQLVARQKAREARYRRNIATGRFIGGNRGDW